MNRRTVLAGLSGLSVAALAGCSQGEDGDEGDGGDDHADHDHTHDGEDGADGNDGAEGENVPAGIESEPLPDSGDEQYLEDVEEFDGFSQEHVEGEVTYDHSPPLGGPHSGRWVDPGYYGSPQPAEELVHSLEHGHVIVYYDPDGLTAQAETSLKAFVDAHKANDWAAVTALPALVDDPAATYVLTAWGARLTLDSYDAKAVRAFIAEYVGRGPENPVR